MDINYTIPTNIATTMVDALCWKHNYQELILNNDGVLVDNPESKNSFAKRMGLEHFQTIYVEYKKNVYLEAGASSLATALSEAETITEAI